MMLSKPTASLLKSMGAALAAFGLMGAAPPKSLTVLELFTSQGCSSCPPANDNVRALSDRPDVLALSFSVTYWDRLGWKDTFGQDGFTDRQIAYAHALRHPGPFTPQVVVDGRADVVGDRRGDIEALIAESRLDGRPSIVFKGSQITLGGAPASMAADVWFVRYDPRVVEVPIRAGENNGRTLPHRNVVRQLIRLGEFVGQPEAFVAPRGPPGLSTAVLVQISNGGPILSAAKSDDLSQ